MAFVWLTVIILLRAVLAFGVVMFLTRYFREMRACHKRIDGMIFGT